MVEELAGTDNEAGPEKLHALEAYVEIALLEMRLEENCDRLRRRRVDCKKREVHSEGQERLRDFCTWSRETFHGSQAGNEERKKKEKR